MHFSKTGKMSSLALGNSHLSGRTHLTLELFTVECGHFVSLHCMVILQVTGKWMPKLTNIVDQSDPPPVMTVIKVVKL